MPKKFLVVFSVIALSLALSSCVLRSPTYTVNGYVKDALGRGVANVKVNISYPNGYQQVLTDENGFWSKSDLSGKITVSPQASGWTFTPSVKIITLNKNESNVNFIGNPSTYFVSGYVRNVNGKGISGVTITFEGSQITTTSVKSDLNGFWKSGILKGKVVVKALKNGWLFTPATGVVVNGLKDNVDFLAKRGIGETMYIPMEGVPAGLAVDEENGKLYVSDFSTDLVFEYNVYGYNLIRKYEVGSNPAGICYDANDKRLFVANSSTNTITVIDASNDKVIKHILIGGSPKGIAFNPQTNRIYVTNSFYNAVDVLSASPVGIVATVRIGQSPDDVTINSNTNIIYVTNTQDNTLSVIDGSDNTLVDDIKVGLKPIGVAVNIATNKIYVVNQASDNVSVIDGNKDEVVKNVKVGKSPSYVYADSQKNMIYVTNTGDNTLSVIDGKNDTVIQTIMIGKGPSWITKDKETGVLYVSNSMERTVSVIH